MRSFRNLIKDVFGNRQIQDQGESYKTFNYHISRFTPFTGDLYDYDTVRTAIRSKIKHIKKLKLRHITKDRAEPKNKNINNLFRKPNRYMLMSDFLEKVFWHRDLTHNAFIYLKRDILGNVVEMFPIPYSNIEFKKIQGILHAKFQFATGQYIIVEYDDLIHLRKDFYSHDLFGDTGNYTLKNSLEVLNNTDQAVAADAKNSTIIRWLLKFKHMLKPGSNLQLQVDDFVREYLNVENSSGVIATLPAYDVEQIKNEKYTSNTEAFKDAKNRVYNYFGTNEKIINNTYNEEEWNCFYNGEIEPFFIQLQEQFTDKLLTNTEIARGQKIITDANRLMYASNATKIRIAEKVLPTGLLTINQVLEIWELPPISDGDRRLQTLNLMNADLIDQYQLSKAFNDKADIEEKDEGGEEDE